MQLAIINDVIELDGFPVATLNLKAPATRLDQFQLMIHLMDDYRTTQEMQDEIDELKETIEDIKNSQDNYLEE